MPSFFKEKYLFFGMLAFILFGCFGFINFVQADFSACGITPTSPLWQAKASDGTVVMAVDSAGNLDIVATTVQTNTAPPASGLTNSFIIKTSTTNKFAFNKTNAYITGSILENQATLPAASGDDLVVKNSAGTAVALFDATTGNIYLKAKSCGAAIRITNCAELQNMKNNLSASYELAPANGSYIDCSDTVNWNGGAGFEPVGNQSWQFNGKFDGKGYTVNNLYINRPSTDKVGLFGYVYFWKTEIKNVGLVNLNIKGGSQTGGLVGYNYNATITNSYTTGAVAGNTSVGGLVGVADNFSTISSSYSTSAVSGGNALGGLIGHNINHSNITNSYATGVSIRTIIGTSVSGGLVGVNGDSCNITNSYSTGAVIGTINGYNYASYIGGLVGWNDDYGHITNSYSTGAVTGNTETGGLVGRNDYAATITNSYSTGAVTGGTNTGGLVGDLQSGTITNSYWDTQTSGQANACGNGSCTGATGKTTTQMAQEATFSGWTFNPTSGANWKLSTIVPTPPKHYPCLPWQADGTCPITIISITDCSGLQNMKNDLANTYELANNIDCSVTTGWNSGAGFEPVGNSTTPFTGKFDGKGFKISNLFINRSGADNIGLFGYASGAIINYLAMESENITGRNYVGGLVGYNLNTTISNSYSTGRIAANYVLGGLVGFNNTSVISNSFSKSEVNGGASAFYVGGLVGANNTSIINNSYVVSSAAVSGYTAVGGLVGYNYLNSIIQNSYSSVSISAYYPALGAAGGLVGYSFNSSIFSSYWNTFYGITDACGSILGGDCAGATGKTTAQMIQESSFSGWTFNPTSGANWKLSTITPVGSYYPCLNWQDNSTCKSPHIPPHISGTIAGIYSAGSGPTCLAFDSSTNSIWVFVTLERRVKKFRASDGSLLGSYLAGDWGGRPTCLAFDSSTNSIWVTDAVNNRITKIRASDGSILGSYATTGGGPADITFDSLTNSIWVTVYKSQTNFKSLMKFRASDGSLLGAYSLNGAPQGIVFDPNSNSIWVSASTDIGFVAKFAVSNGALLGTYALGSSPSSLTFDSFTNSIWAISASNEIRKFKSSDGTLISAYMIPNSTSYQSIAFDPSTNSIWVINPSDNKVIKLNSVTGNNIGTYTVADSLYGIAFDPSTDSIWASRPSSLPPNANAIIKIYTGAN